MKYKSTILVETDLLLEEVFAPEKEGVESDRASWNISKKGRLYEFAIEAKDSTALRATLNSITKLLTVADEMKSVK